MSPCAMGHIDYYPIARLALHFARCYDGVIDMTGAIIPWDRPYGQCSVDEVREFLSGIGGTVWEVLPEASHDADATQLRPYHVVDVEFLEAWPRHSSTSSSLEAWHRHPKFQMVK
jgi:hypothetical protein